MTLFSNWGNHDKRDGSEPDENSETSEVKASSKSSREEFMERIRVDINSDKDIENMDLVKPESTDTEDIDDIDNEAGDREIGDRSPEKSNDDDDTVR